MNGRELAQFARVNERQIYRWVERGWLKAVRRNAGHWYRDDLAFEDEEVAVARMMGALVRAGMYPDAAHKLARGNVKALYALLLALGPLPHLAMLHYKVTRDAGRAGGPLGQGPGPGGAAGRGGSGGN